MQGKKWVKRLLLIWFVTVIFMISVVYIVDPYFHFHKPFSFISYRLYDERYINDGISRHFEYDAIVTGTSMAQNFKPSEVDALFGTKCVKETFSGAGYRELSDNLERALKRNKNLKTVIWSMDYNAMYREYDWRREIDIFPTYLYDDNPFNDVAYIFNKDVWYSGILTNVVKTVKNEESTTMDEYSSWDKETGYDNVIANYERWPYVEPFEFTQTDREMVTKNIKYNFVDLVNKYPETTFYIFFPPYSILFWDGVRQEGLMDMQFEEEKIAEELLLECPNVKLYNFFDKYDIVMNFDNYRDKEHYSAEINSKILEWIKAGDGLVTKENYIERLNKEKEFYSNYDYDSEFGYLSN